jgi:hypothetical protein
MEQNNEEEEETKTEQILQEIENIAKRTADKLEELANGGNKEEE